jgi:ribosome-binding protein aMBF1 (putative translation factor)
MRRKRRLVLETPYRIRGRPVIVHVEAAGLRICEKGCRAGTLAITWAQIYNRAAEITAERARQRARGRKMER